MSVTKMNVQQAVNGVQTVGNEPIEKIWEKIKMEAASLFEDQVLVYEMFLQPSKTAVVIDQTLYVSVESPLGKEILNNLAISRLRPLLARFFIGVPTLQFIINDDEKILKMTNNPAYIATTGRLSGVNAEMVFDNLVLGKFNEQAIKASQQLIEEPAERWNPLFIYGDTGVGKSHLLSAIGNKFHIFYPNLSIKLVDSQEFTREIYESIRTGGEEVEKLKRSYENLGLLLIDDVQMLANREKTNEILFHIVNSFINNKKPVVLASDKNPEQLKGFENRMLSRFRAGLQVKIGVPDEQTIKKITMQKISASPQKIALTQDALDYLASKHFEDIRVLQGAIGQLLFFANEEQSPKSPVIDLEECKRILELGQGLVAKQGGGEARRVIESVCSHYGVSENLVKSDGRQAKIVRARQIAMYIMRSAHNMTYSNIGREFGNRDHSTVMAACKKIETELSVDKALGETINKLISQKQ